MTQPRIGIIGGGLTGLTTAYELAKEDVNVTIFEAGDRLGGLAAGYELAGKYRMEQAYHFLYKTDEFILAMVEELGLSDKLTYHKSSVSTYYGDTLYPMESPIDLIRFSPISFFDRIRAGVTVLWLQRERDWRKLSKMTALEWLRKYAGRSVTDVIWEPLLKGKFDRYYDKVTMSWLWGRVLQRVDSRDAKIGGEALGYFKGGFKTIIDAMEVPLKAAGTKVAYNTFIETLHHDAETGEVVVTLQGGGEERFDRVLATVPSNVLAKMIAGYESVDPDYFEKIRSVDYLDAAVLSFVTPQKITDYYWHNINTPDSPFVVFLSFTALIGTEDFDGNHVYYIGDYIPAEHKYMSMPADELKAYWYSELQKMFPDFDPSQIIDAGLFRMRNAQHIVDIGFEENKLVPHETPCPGVLMCNFSQIYPMDRGTNYAVRDGVRMARMLLDSLASGTTDVATPTVPPLTMPASGRKEEPLPKAAE
ncbi:MAG: FAD-dependent oxidoreductase [Pseudomonadota bacterium]